MSNVYTTTLPLPTPMLSTLSKKIRPDRPKYSVDTKNTWSLCKMIF